MTSLDSLTERQREVYDFIREKIRTRGYGPTVREIGTNFKISSPNGVMCHLKALEKKGLITREPNMSRAIMLATESFDSMRPGLPLAGRIAAGMLHEAVEQNERIDFGELFDSPDLFVLEVSGDSMIEDQISDGDYVVIRKQDTANKGVDGMKKEDIEHLASLFRIRLSEEEKEKFGKDLSSIVSYVSVVSEIASSEVDEAPEVGPLHNIFRQDEITNKPDEYTEDILREMPATEGRFMKVKKILKTE